MTTSDFDILNTNEPAFPTTSSCGESRYEGMTLLDYFAASALTGLLAATTHYGTSTIVADNAYKIAIAMLDVRFRQ